MGTSVSPCIEALAEELRARVLGRGLHSSTFQLNLGRLGHTSACPPV